MSVEESGYAEYSGSYGRKKRYWEEDEEEDDGLPHRLHSLAANQAKLDVSVTTLKSGRPYTLRFVKTQASYERKVAQRQRDEANRECLLGLRLGI